MNLALTVENKQITFSVAQTSPVSLTVGNPAVSFNVLTSFPSTIVYIQRLEIDFTYEDWADTKKSIGNMDKDFRAVKIAVIIDDGDEFDEGTITIGDDSAHGRLMTAAVCDLTKANTYHNEQDSEYAEDTNVYVYFETGAPTQGTGTIIIYLL